MFSKLKKRLCCNRTVEKSVKVTVKKKEALNVLDIKKIILESMNQMKSREFGP